MPVPKGQRYGGRQKGTKNKATIEREAMQAEAVAAAKSAGISPLEVLLGAMRHAWEANDKDAACRYAKDAAPYVHPRLAAVEHMGKDGGPIETVELSEKDRARRIAYLLNRVSRANGHAQENAEDA